MPKRHQGRLLGILVVARKENAHTVTALEAPRVRHEWDAVPHRFPNWQRAGVHETSIYRRWRTKEALINDAIMARTAGQLPVPDLGSVRADLIELLRAALGFLRSPIGGALVRMAVALPPSPQATNFKRDFWSSRFPAILTVIGRGVERGELDPNVDRQLLMEMFIGLFHVRVFLMDNPHDEGLAERVVDLALRGATAGESRS